MDNNVIAKHILDVAVGLEKKSKNELIAELSDIFDNASKIDLNSKENINSLKNLAKAFDAIFSKAGNKSINFADLIEMPPPAMFAEMGKIAATSFWDAWNSVGGSSKSGMSQDVLKKELASLTKQREALVKRQKTLPHRQEKLDSLSDILYAEQDEFSAFSKDELKKFGKSVDEVALDMTDALSRTMDELSNLKGGTQEFEDALERAYEQLNNVFRMSRTLSKQPNLVNDKTILDDYDFDLLQEDYVDSLMEYEKAFANMMFAIQKEMDGIPAKLKDIDNKILQIRNSGIEVVDQASAKNGLKTLNEIEAAYKKIRVAQGDRIDDRQAKHILSALEFDPATSKEGIKVLYEQYKDAAASGDWVEEYRALLKYVRLYESYLTTANKAHNNKITKRDNPFTPLYERLKPMADNAQNMLQNILNMGEGKPLVGIGGAGGNGTGAPTPEDAANAQKLREEAEAKVKAEREALALARQKREEEEKLAKVAEKKKLAEDAVVKGSGTIDGNISVILQDMNAFLSSNKDKKIRDYFDLIASGAREMSSDVQAAIESTIGSLGSLSSINDGANNFGGLIGEKTALILRKPNDDRAKQLDDKAELQNRLKNAKVTDINIGKIQELISAEEYLVELQNRVSGAPVSTIGAAIEGVNPEVVNATEASIQSLVEAMRALYNAGVQLDVENLGNILYDGQSDKFGIVDMDVITEGARSFKSFEEMLGAFVQAVRNQVEDITSILNDPSMAKAWSRFADMVDGEAAKAQGMLPSAAGVEEVQKVESVNEHIKETVAILEKERLTYEDVLALVREYNDESRMKALADAGNWDEYDKIFAHHVDIADKLVPINMMGMGSDSPDKWLATVGISAETAAQRLKELYDRLHQVVSVDDELGDASYEYDDIAKENGALEDKIELLQEIAEQYGNTITQKNRDRYEELNQKDMNEGLTPKEDERYWELGEQIEEADNALEEFGQTYDKIIVKLENGKKVEILPDDKGLRTLAKIDEEYGESYNGVQIEDVIFERVKQEAVATEQAVDGLNESLEKTHQLTSGGGTGDASLADLEAERMKSEALQDELDHRIGALQAAHDENEMLQSDLNVANEQIRIAQDSEMAARARADETDLKLIEKDKLIQTLEEQLDQSVNKDSFIEAYRRADAAEERASMYDRAMTSMSEEMADLRGKLANVKTGEGEDGTSVKLEELKTLLDSIVYNVKIVHDDSDKEANKIALDESALEVTLNKVFANIINANDKNVSSGGSKSGNKNPYLLTDANGNALTIYRGVRDSFSGLVASRTGTFGTDNQNIAKGYTHGDGKIFAYNAEMHNPLEIQAKGAQLKQIANLGNAFEAVTDPILKELRSLWSQLTKLKEQLKTASGFDKEVTIPGQIDALQRRIQEISEDESHVYGVGGTDLFARKAKKNGYDGVIFRDLVDPSSTTPPSERVPSNIIVTFDENQMHLLETLSVVGNEIAKDNEYDSAVVSDDLKTDKNGDAKGGSYALESTLQLVKGVLDNIQTNTAKVETISPSNVDAIAGTALDSRLAEIKSVLESIDGKIAKGGVIATRGAVKQANSQPIESEAKAQAARSNMMKSLINDYKTLGKLAAQFASDNDLETKAMLENLKEEISRKRKSLRLTMDESAGLREKYSLAFDAEKRLLDAAKAQEAINAKNKADAKDDANAWKKQVKDAQREKGINAADSTYRATSNTVVRAIGADGITADIEAKAKELDKQNKILNSLRNGINKKGIKATEKDRDALSKQISKVKELKTEVDGYLKIHEKYSGEGATQFNDVDTSNFGAVGTDQYWNNITAAIKNAATGKTTIKGLNADTGELTGTTRIAANTFAEWSATVDPITGKLSILRIGIKKTETVIEQIQRKTKEIFTYFSGSSLIFKAVNELKKGVQYVRDIDLALTELKKVTDATEETYDKFLQTASKTASKVGSTIKDVVSSTADWARLGYSMKEAAQFAETTQILMNVSEFTDVSQATDTLISSVQAFGYTADTSMDVVDLLNTIGNNYAISTADLAQSLTKSSASLVAAGGDLAEAAALTATANKIIQDADSVGTALKTTSLRLRGTDVKVLEEEGLDSEGAVTSKSKLQGKVKALSGVDILTATGEYKSTYEILSDIADVWESMNDMDQAALLELIAGKRNSSVVAAILQNPKELKEAYEDAANAEGSALKENEKYLDSIQGKIDQFNNAVQTLWSNTLDSDVIKFLVDLATKLIKIVDSIGPLNVALVGVVAFLEKKHGVFSNFFNPAESGAEEAARQVREAFDSEKAKRSLSAKKGNITKRSNKLRAEGKTFAEIQEDPKIKQWTQEVQDGQQALDEYNASVQRADATLRQSNTTTAQATAAERVHTNATTASAGATGASAAAEAADTTATTTHTAATWADVWAEMTRTGATGASVAATIKQVIATKLASAALVKKGLAIIGVTAAEGASIPVTTMLAGGFVGLASSIWSAITAMWTFMVTTPIGWILLAVAAVVALGVAFAAIHKSSAELREELSGLKEEISGIKDEIESLNGELETTQERMAELLAKDSLTFTEQEELENLQKQNDLLEREIYLLEQREKRLQKEAQKTFDDLMDKETREKDRDGDGEDEVYDRSLERKMRKYEKWAQEYEDAKQALVEAERSEDERAIEKAEKRVEKAEKKKDKFYDKVNDELGQYLEDADGIDYASADAETRKYLDYIYNTEGRFNVANGDAQAKSIEIKRIFNKDNMSGASDEIDKLVEKLTKNPGDQSIISQISEQCKLAEKDLKAVGLSVNDATDYFTKLGTNASFNTVDGKVAEIQIATSRFQSLLSDTKSTDFTSLFDKDGKVVETAIAEYFQGTSEATRAEISKLVKNIHEGKISVEDALKTFELFSVQSIIDIQVKEVQTNFKDIFADLEDADGLVDTFKELGDAIGSTVGALEAFNQAQADVADKGFVSIQTALQLMEYTDDYGSVLQVVDGKLQLAANAEQNLIQARIDAIKVSAQTAVADAQAAYDKAELAVQSYRSAMVEEASASTVATAWQKIVAVAAGIKNALDNIWSGENIGDLYNSGYNTYLESATGYETSYDDAGLQALEDALADADKKLNEAKGNSEIANAMTADNLENLYKSSDKSTVDEVEDDAFQREMDYWENRIAANQAKYEQLQNEIDLLEAKGQKADASFYEEQIKLENQRLDLLDGQKKAAEAHLATLEEGSEEWWEVANVLNDIEGELDDVTASIVDLQDAIAEIETYKFEEFNNRLDNLASKLETIRNLIAPDGEEDWFDDEGAWTESGVAVLGSYLQELETYKQGYEETIEELDKYAASYEGNEAYYEALGIHSEQEYYDKTEELISQQYDFAESISDTEQSVIDMYENNIDAVEEYTETLIDNYNDYIDSVKEALDAERDLYDFKKNVQKQAKDIAAIERRIASLSGSTNKSDIAERRKLEAQLYESRESLNDTFYDHAKNAQSEALDKEAEAYETSMNNMIEGLRTSLEEATLNMDEFLMGVTSMVMYNADTVLAKYEETNLPLTKELTNPWDEAKKAVGSYSGNALDLMNQWTKEGGFFAQFNATGTTNLQSPWSAGTSAANSFRTSVSTVMSGVVSNIATNVKTASGELSKLYQQIQDTEKRAASANVAVASTGSSNNSGGYVAPQKKYYVTAFLDLGSRSLSVTKSDSNASAAMSAAKIAILGEYEKVKGNSASAENAWLRTWRDRVKYTTQYYAKGATSTPRDEWAITDEPQFGDELVLVPGKDGNLSFMRKGTGVVPADLTANLMEWGQFTPDSVNLGGGINVNMINNAVNKPEFNFAFDALVKAENITEETLPAVKKLVTQELNRFTKELNYALKGKGAR